MISDIELNKKTRIENIERKYAIFDGEKIFFSSSMIKGSWNYANQIRQKIDTIVPGKKYTKNFFFTLTWGSRDVCTFCSYKFIMNNWRSFRQNWINYGLPKINSYVGVLEPHKDWYPHLHFYINLNQYLKKNQMSQLHDIWGSRVDFQKAKNPKKYLFKYLTKGLKNLDFISLLGVLNGRQYFASRNVFQKQETQKEKIYQFLGEADGSFGYNHFKIIYDYNGVSNSLSDFDYISGANHYDLYGKFDVSLAEDQQIVETY